MIKINRNEATVLEACLTSALDNGGDFGFTGEIVKFRRLGQFSKHQIAGYISSLEAKRCFELTDCRDLYAEGVSQLVPCQPMQDDLYASMSPEDVVAKHCEVA